MKVARANFFPGTYLCIALSKCPPLSQSWEVSLSAQDISWIHWSVLRFDKPDCWHFFLALLFGLRGGHGYTSVQLGSFHLSAPHSATCPSSLPRQSKYLSSPNRLTGFHLPPSSIPTQSYAIVVVCDRWISSLQTVSSLRAGMCSLEGPSPRLQMENFPQMCFWMSPM